jgi:FMN phosphatase YigB (HAD superfamily)
LKLTLLLDLDDTLLKNSMDTFLPGYLQAWSEFMSSKIDPKILINAFLVGTRSISENPNFDCTLREGFDEVFYPMVGMTPEEFQPYEDRFYNEIFPKLKSLTQPAPGGEKFVESAFEHGYDVAIATNPYFPRTAIEQRLEWAGLPVEKYPFALVPSIETFHYGKPHTAFFAELLAHLGWPDGLIVMVGDEPNSDIFPADQFGLPTFWVSKPTVVRPENLRMPHHSGDLVECLVWLEQLDTIDFVPDFNSSAALLATLNSTPATLHSLCQTLSSEQWTYHPEPDEWCPAEIICHLRDVDNEVNIPRFRKILLEDNPFLTGMDTDRWNKERHYHFQDGPQALLDFITARKDLLTLLEALDSQSWQRIARHSIFGRTDLAELVSFIVGHDRMHIRQILDDLKKVPTTTCVS